MDLRNRYTTIILQKNNKIYYDISDDFGLWSPVIQKIKPFHTKRDTSIIVARVYLTEENASSGDFLGAA